MKIKIVLGIEYNGFFYCGWQRQKNLNTIQNFLELSLKKITNENIHVFCAGRTDSGAHAIYQVVHFETTKIFRKSTWIFGVNRYLPNDISVRWYKIVDSKFHARFTAISRRYCYIVFNNKIRESIFLRNVLHYPIWLDVDKMIEASRFIEGKHDFSSFRSSNCQSKTSYRVIEFININRLGDYIIFDIKANSFLYKMVRNIVGNLIEIGRGKKKINWMKDLLLSKDNKKSVKIVSSIGLYLVDVEYPKKYSFPKIKRFPFF